ncbi:BZ3500_MvSof-1268-A1-R1_Chr1-2g01342 [Microbotryum saponariae]|uniref:BZ3500_MvSof-1268-A1-R1_Chr1-2g01342 protein n=1 Tax=Microbotryum saponariae TaxID=289078 RepID=A0A2X0KJY6_9BASI|nr:BZ3500_MvSof-1268-A1-R1_Chr1-2g01342 [Microbotryum saponariae]SCZ97154.1 BZ3501_MvSof-1269-A2-R1_Chr1-2g00941 [Microbotryum saponariae]
MARFANTSSQWALGGETSMYLQSRRRATFKSPVILLTSAEDLSGHPPPREERDRDRDRQARASFERSARGAKTSQHHSSPLKDNHNPHRRSHDQVNAYLDYELGARLCGLQPPQQSSSGPSPPRHPVPSRNNDSRHHHPTSQGHNTTPPRVTNSTPTRPPLPSPGIENVALRKPHELPNQGSDSRARREKCHHSGKQKHDMQVAPDRQHACLPRNETIPRISLEKVDYRLDLSPEPEYYGGGVGTLSSVIPPLPPQQPLTSAHGTAYPLAHKFQTTPVFTSYDSRTLPGAYPTSPAYHATGVEPNLLNGVDRLMHEGEPVDRGEFDGFHCTDRQFAEDGRHVVSNLGLIEGFSMAFKDEVEMIDDALEAMIANAKRQGANGVLGMQVDLADDGAVIARGQAVVLV